MQLDKCITKIFKCKNRFKNLSKNSKEKEKIVFFHLFCQKKFTSIYDSYEDISFEWHYPNKVGFLQNIFFCLASFYLVKTIFMHCTNKISTRLPHISSCLSLLFFSFCLFLVRKCNVSRRRVGVNKHITNALSLLFHRSHSLLLNFIHTLNNNLTTIQQLKRFCFVLRLVSLKGRPKRSARRIRILLLLCYQPDYCVVF